MFPQTQNAVGLNPYHIALIDEIFSSLAIQGHVQRAFIGDKSPAVKQDLVMVYSAYWYRYLGPGAGERDTHHDGYSGFK